MHKEMADVAMAKRDEELVEEALRVSLGETLVLVHEVEHRAARGILHEENELLTDNG
jgi:hypothetical protein